MLTTSTVLAVSTETLRKAQQEILACESCSHRAHVPFSRVLDWVTGRAGAATEYVLPGAAICPGCMESVFEDTEVEWP